MLDEGTIRQEIKQRRPFASRSEEALVSLLRTTDVVKHRLGATVEARGVTLQQYNVLRILRGAGEEGLPTLEIASRVLERAPGLTRLIGRLEGKGLVRRCRGSEDRRQVLCRISPRGRRLVTALDLPVRRAAEGCLEALSERDTLVLVRLLDTVRAEAGSPLPARGRSGRTPGD
jgi:DNA-binding MarR family transcriptional regulator